MKKIVHKFVVMEKSLNSHAIWETKAFLMTDAMTIAHSRRTSHVQKKTMKAYVLSIINYKLLMLILKETKPATLTT